MKVSVPVPSMVNPSTDDMLEKTHSRYTLVVLASKRARQLLSGKTCRVENRSSKYVTNAMEEIIEDKVTYKMNGSN